MKSISLLIGAVYLCSQISTSDCPVHDKVGNAINFLRLFKDQIDADWSYQNLNTNFKLRLHQIDTENGLF